MSESPGGFQLFPKDLLGDDWYLAMSWDARGMHVHLLCIAWQQIPPCSLPDDDRLLQSWVGYPKEWPRLKEEIFRAWRLQDGRWWSDYLLRQRAKQEDFRDSRRKAAEIRWGKKNTGKEGDAIDARAMHVQKDASVMHMQKGMQNDASLSLFSSKDLLSLSPPPRSKEAAPVSEAQRLFDEKFWPAFPRQEAREKAEREFLRVNPSAEVLDSMLGWLAIARESEQWRDLTFVPHASKWLSERRWESEPPPQRRELPSRAEHASNSRETKKLTRAERKALAIGVAQAAPRPHWPNGLDGNWQPHEERCDFCGQRVMCQWKECPHPHDGITSWGCASCLKAAEDRRAKAQAKGG